MRKQWSFVLAILVATPAIGQSPVPPEVAFGHRVGADSQLVTYAQSIDYFRRLAASSQHVQLLEVGKTSFGRPWTVALISSPANLARIGQI